MQREVTKVWSTAPPVLTTIQTTVATRQADRGRTSVGPTTSSRTWSTCSCSISTVIPWTAAVPESDAQGGWSLVAATFRGTPVTTGVTQLPVFTAAGLHTLTVYNVQSRRLVSSPRVN